jgi:hypothetical protein
VVLVEKVVEVVVADPVGVISGCEGVEVEVVSEITSPITQYGLPASRSGQLTPGLMVVKRSTVMPQLKARDSQVSPLAAGVSK